MILPKHRVFDICGVGDADIDIMVAVKDFPDRGQKSSGRILGKYPGGMVANLLASASSMGAKCCGILCVGDDEFGRISLDDLKKRGVDVSSSVIRKGADTYFTTNCIAPDGEKRMILCFGDAIYPTPDEVSEERIASSKICQMTGSHISLSIPVARMAKKHGTLVSLDLERLNKAMSDGDKKTLLSLSDIVFPNEEGLFSYSGEMEIEKGARKLLSMGPEIVVVTRGGNGADLFTQTQHYHMPALADKVLDTTGAGDTFIGAFLASITREYDLKTCLSLASAASAIQVGSVGCRTSLSSMEQAFSFLKEKDTIPSF